MQTRKLPYNLKSIGKPEEKNAEEKTNPQIQRMYSCDNETS